MGLFKKNIFKGYYQKELSKNDDAYNYLRLIYVNKVIQVLVASLLEMKIEPEGMFLKFSGKCGEGYQSYLFSPHNLEADDLSKDVYLMNELGKLIAKEAKLKCPNKIIKQTTSFDEIVHELLYDVSLAPLNTDDFSNQKKRLLFSAVRNNILLARYTEYVEDRDMILASALTASYAISQPTAFKAEKGDTATKKLINVCERAIDTECNLVGGVRLAMLRSQCDKPNENKNYGYWDYINQMERIKNCPEMW